MKSVPDTENNSGDKTMNKQDLEAELGIHPVRRPTNIEKDVNSLGQKKRVSSILRSPDFKEELESVVTDLLRSDKGGGHVIAQAIANVFSPASRSIHQGIGCVSPINDLTGADTSLYSKGEKLLRCKLAALYRIVDLYGWTSAIYNHITLRVCQEQEHFLINPFGLLYHEVSAAKLMKVNMQGEMVDQGSTTLGFNLAGYTLHSAIHAARPDIHCIIHLHSSDVVAVSCMECGFLPLSQEALIVGEVSYHNYHGILIDSKEKKAIQKHLGPNNKVMFLRNHGLVACGSTAEEAFHHLYFTMLACSIQVKALSCMKPEKLVLLDRSALKHLTEDVGRKDVSTGHEEKISWRVGEMLFESHIRMLDDMGYRSGYLYRNPVIVQHKPRLKSDVELPATVVGHTAILPEDLEGVRGQLKQKDHPQWVNSPNLYTRVLNPTEEEVYSAASSHNGDASPKVKTKWVRADEWASAKGASVRISNPNQFVPTNTDPREVLQIRKSIRSQGRWDQNRPGPQSQLLHSVSPDKPSTGVATSSKAIIEKGNEVDLVSPAGPPNPFNTMSNDRLKEYEKEVMGDAAQYNDDIMASEVKLSSNEEEKYRDVGENAIGNQVEKADDKESDVRDEISPLDAWKSDGDGVMHSPEKRPSEPQESLEETTLRLQKSPELEKSVASPAEAKESGKKKKKRPLSFLKKKK